MWAVCDERFITESILILNIDLNLINIRYKFWLSIFFKTLLYINLTNSRHILFS